MIPYEIDPEEYKQAIDGHDRAQLMVPVDVVMVGTRTYGMGVLLPAKVALDMEKELNRCHVVSYLAIKYPYANRDISVRVNMWETIPKETTEGHECHCWFRARPDGNAEVTFKVRAYESDDPRIHLPSQGVDCLESLYKHAVEIVAGLDSTIVMPKLHVETLGEGNGVTFPDEVIPTNDAES